MKLKSSLLSGLIILSSSIPGAVSSSSGSTITSFESSSIYYDLKSDPNFDFTKYRLNTDTPDDKAIKAITLVRENTNLYFYVFNENGKPLTTDLKAMQVSISTSTDYSDTHYYNCLTIDKTEDNLFYKFKIPNVTSTSNIYHFADLEFDYGKGYSEGRHNTIAKSWFFENSSAKNANKVKELDVINFKINPGSYRFDVINGNSSPDFLHFYDLFYITFQLDKSLGDLIGLKMSWKEKVTDINHIEFKDYFNPTISETDNSYESDTYTIDYKYNDVFDVKSFNTEAKNNIWSFLTKTLRFNYTNDVDYDNIPRIEKINYDNKNSSSFDNYFFSDETKNLLNDQYYDVTYGNKDQYVIRFALKDFCNSEVDTIDVYHKIYIKTEIIDCSVLTLTFSKDGIVYTLIASNKPVNHDPGDLVPGGNPTFIDDILNAINEFKNNIENFFGQFTDFFMILFAIIFVLFIIWLLKILFVPRSRR